MTKTLDVEGLNRQLEEKSPQQVLEWALSEFHPKISLASSFGAEDMVLTDMLRKMNPDARIFALETGRLHQETYDLMDKAREKYGDFEIFYPDTAHLEEITRNHGLNLFYRSMTLRKLCCEVRKVEPLKRALSDLDAWITGLRRDQASTRVAVQKVEVDTLHGGIIKINPLADQTSEDVWRYIRNNNVPYNALHDNGYPSIGCEPCTRAVKPGEDPRAGRWWWEPREASECGLHKK
ncbi:MAG: phosphoadenylyl-sulfate reductase [Thaumarchaeota archaeon]|nr:phosphoadenylyl-sulfate reductase [Nitrososphaerota archaeon]MCL5318093.1 phosphoadenylyl-sulfate reductase [Nitrososphaerota archaeon]